MYYPDIYLWNERRPNRNMSIESPYMTSHFMAIEMFALPHNFHDICNRIVNYLSNHRDNSKYANRKPMNDFTFYGNSNIILICYNLDIFKEKKSWPRTWPFEWAKVKWKYADRMPTCEILCPATVTFTTSVTVCEVITSAISKLASVPIFYL